MKNSFLSSFSWSSRVSSSSVLRSSSALASLCSVICSLSRILPLSSSHSLCSVLFLFARYWFSSLRSLIYSCNCLTCSLALLLGFALPKTSLSRALLMAKVAVRSSICSCSFFVSRHSNAFCLCRRLPSLSSSTSWLKNMVVCLVDALATVWFSLVP